MFFLFSLSFVSFLIDLQSLCRLWHSKATHSSGLAVLEELLGTQQWHNFFSCQNVCVCLCLWDQWQRTRRRENFTPSMMYCSLHLFVRTVTYVSIWTRKSIPLLWGRENCLCKEKRITSQFCRPFSLFSLFFLVSQIRPAEESICGMPVRILVRQGRQLSGVCVCEEMLLHSCEMRLWWAWAQAKTHTLGESATVIDLSRKWEHCSSRNNTVFGPCVSQPASTLDDGRKQIYL